MYQVFKRYFKADRKNKIPAMYFVTATSPELNKRYRLELVSHFGGVYDVICQINGIEGVIDRFYSVTNAKKAIDNFVRCL